METSDLVQLARTQESRVDKLDNEVGRLKYDGQQTRGAIAEIRSQFGKVAKEVSHPRFILGFIVRQYEELNGPDVSALSEEEEEAFVKVSHRIGDQKFTISSSSVLRKAR
jgi:hypothetical protein